MIDTNSWLGPWPFSLEPERTAAALWQDLQAVEATAAWVSPLDAVFAPDPQPANLRLLRKVKRFPALIPVPVINPALPVWPEHLAACQRRGPIRAVRLLPNYHGYRLSHPNLSALLATAREQSFQVIINTRLVDTRTQYFGLNIRGVPMVELRGLLQKHPDAHPVITGLFRPELKALAVDHTNFSADIAFCEWIQVVADLLTVMPARRLLLGTNSPLLSLRGQVDKLRCARIPARTKRSIARTNAERLFS